MNLSIALAADARLAQAPPLTKAEQLQDAARKGDAAAVKKLLDEGVDVNTKFRYNATALFYACDHGHLDVVKVLLDHGADMNVKDTFYGFTPLMLAIGPAQKKTPEHTEIAKLLIAKGAPGQGRGADRARSSRATRRSQSRSSTAAAFPPSSLSDALEAREGGEQDRDGRAARSRPARSRTRTSRSIRALLAKFAGTYKGPDRQRADDRGRRRAVHDRSGRRAARAAADAGRRPATRTFKAIGAPVTIAFQVDGDKVDRLHAGAGRESAARCTRAWRGNSHAPLYHSTAAASRSSPPARRAVSSAELAVVPRRQRRRRRPTASRPR